MRLPAFFTALSPIGETLNAMEAGEALMTKAAAARNAQLTVSSADDGLSLWEKDYSLSVAGNTDARRARIRAALAGGRTLTPQQLAELAVSVGNAAGGEVEEFFADCRVVLHALYETAFPEDITALEEAVESLKPAHLSVEISPLLVLRGQLYHHAALQGAMYLELQDYKAEEP